VQARHRPAEVTEFENTSLRVQQQVLRLDVTMTDALRVKIRQTSEYLVHVELLATDTHTQTV